MTSEVGEAEPPLMGINHYRNKTSSLLPGLQSLPKPALKNSGVSFVLQNTAEGSRPQQPPQRWKLR